MCEIRECSYEEMVRNLNRNELIVLDTNVWLDLFVYYSYEEINELFSSVEKDYYIHEVFVLPHIIEEYINGKKKIKNTYEDTFKKNKEQLLSIYDDMNGRINKFDESFNNCVGYHEIVDKSNLFYKDIKQMIDSLVVGDTVDYEKKEKIIDIFLERCSKNYHNVKMLNKTKYLRENIWNSDSKKKKNYDGDLKIWNELLELSSNYNCEKIILIENEKKEEWDRKKLQESLWENSSLVLEIIDFKTFVCNYLTCISYSLFCKCVNYYDRYHIFMNIAVYSELVKYYANIMNNFTPMNKHDVSAKLKELIEYDVKLLNLESNLKNIKIQIDDIEPLSEKTGVVTTTYDEVRLNHKFKQKVKCVISIDDSFGKKFFLDNLFVEYNIVSNRLLMHDTQFLDEWIEKHIDHDFKELKKHLKCLL